MRIALLALLGAVSVGSTAQAQDTSVFQPKFTDGRLNGCEIVFDSYIQDTAYLQGAAVHVAGSWAFNFVDAKGLYGFLKIGVTPQPSASNNTLAPSDAYLIVDFASNKADQIMAIDSETPGFKIFGFDALADPTMNALVAPSGGQFTVAYTLNGGSVPNTFTVRLSDDDAGQYQQCVNRVLSNVRESLGG